MGTMVGGSSGGPKAIPPSIASPFRSDCLRGKVALVTGGGSGICFEIANQLLLHGARGVVICGRRESFLLKACEALRRAARSSWRTDANNNHDGSSPPSSLGFPLVLYKVCDVRDANRCREVVSYVLSSFDGRLDILVNGAAGNFLAEASALSPKGFRTVMEIDTLGTYNMTHACYGALKKTKSEQDMKTGGGGRGGGVVINISATLQYGATWYQAHASAAKSAVDSLTRTLALEWGSDNIRVVGIAPGPIADTPGTTKLAPGMSESSEMVSELIREGVPLGRMGRTTEIGWTAVFLCSEAGSYITGDVLVVDGGQWLHKPPMIPRELVADLSRQVEAKSRAQKPKLMSKL